MQRACIGQVVIGAPTPTMSRALLIESGPFETRVALLEDGRLAEVHYERTARAGLVGNIYKGRVSRVLPGIQAAFVDIGLDRDAFLFAGDLQPASGEEIGAEGPAQDRDVRQVPIEQRVQPGEELLLQVVKEPLRQKGARISTQLSLPGRFLVLLPGVEETGISRRIEDEKDREALLELLAAIRPREGGLIARTAALGRSRQELEHDLVALQQHWRNLEARAAKVRAPATIHQESPLAIRALRDLAEESIDEIWIEGYRAWKEMVAWAEATEPTLVERLHRWDDESLLFDRFHVDEQIAKAMSRRVWLRSGGFIVIDPTEALIAIDVNSGRSTDGSELEQTAYETNLEAVEAIAGEIRRRDLAGIIVVDFIDMQEVEHRRAVMKALEEAMTSDRSRSQLSQMSDFGLVAITRKRTRGGLQQQLTERCPCCGGSGRVRDALTLGLEIARELRRRPAAGRAVKVRVHRRVKSALEGEHKDVWETLSSRLEGEVKLEPAADLGLEEFEIRERR